MEITNNDLIEIFISRCSSYCMEFCTDFTEAVKVIKYIYNGKTYIIYKSDLPYIETLIERLGGENNGI